MAPVLTRIPGARTRGKGKDGREGERGEDADLEGGNMRHIGSISNPCLTKRPFLQRAYQEPPPVSGAPIGQHRFVMAGGYRIGANQFAAVGHSLRDLKEEGGSGASKCYWIALDGGYAEGRVRVIYPAEHHWLLYETAIYECTLLVNSTGTTGGSAILMLDEQAVVMHEEGQDEFAIDAPPPYHLAFCSYPMYRHLNPKTIQEWLQIALHYLRVEYFVLNDGASVPGLPSSPHATCPTPCTPHHPPSITSLPQIALHYLGVECFVLNDGASGHFFFPISCVPHTMCPTPCAPHPVPHTLCSTPCVPHTLCPTPRAPHHVPHTMCPTTCPPPHVPHTTCPTPCALHRVPHTMHPTPQIALHYLGVEYFVLNDGASIVEDVYEVLEPYMAAGMMEILDMRGGYK
ncbi:unnamed protein product [Closterium sp. Naga37s-1]|nr:unnamed protein product [Closterium sp. Naga37s-1]